jgi:tRNA-dihydrouridine synthase 2
MRPRERAIREQLKMIADICRQTGVACLMNGDVANRAQAKQLISEFGVDGAMIATAAESNSSCFRSKPDGGLAPRKEVVEQYLKFSMEVDNRWGNTKYLLGHLIPGKMPVYQQMTGSKSYHQACKVLGLEQLEAQAKETDERLGITPETEYPGRKGKKNKSALAAGGNQSNIRHQAKKSFSERGIPARPAVALNV